MLHHKKNRKFGRERAQRKALMSSLASSLISKGKITTTEAKAKEIRPYVEKLITKAKHDTLGNRRLIASRLNASLSKMLVEKVSPKYKDRNGGYTRIAKMSIVRGDGSAEAVIEFV